MDREKWPMHTMVGTGVGKITLYKGKEVVKRNIDSEKAVDALIDLIKENNDWIEHSEENEAPKM